MRKHDDYSDYWEDQEKEEEERRKRKEKWLDEHFPPILAPFHEMDYDDDDLNPSRRANEPTRS